MLRFSILFLLLSSFSLPAWAQDELIDDQIDQVAFEGSIHYRISYHGPNTGLWALNLPDSMVIHVEKGNLLVEVLGGAADSLMHYYLWMAEEDQFFLLDDQHQVAFTDPMDFKYAPKKKKKTDGNASICGLDCQEYQINEAGNFSNFFISEEIYFPVPEEDSTTGSRPTFIQAGLNTIPLRMLRKVEGVSITTEAISINREVPEIGVGVLQQYTIKPFFPQVVRHPYIKEK